MAVTRTVAAKYNIGVLWEGSHVVEVLRFVPERKGITLSWVQKSVPGAYMARETNGDPCIKIPMFSKEWKCSLGDYIVKQKIPQKGDIVYPCSSVAFLAKYKMIK